MQEVVAQLAGLADRHQIPLRELLGASGEASFVPALVVPALLVVSPLSGVPLFSSFCGLTILLISVQMMARRNHIWLPDFLANRNISGERLQTAVPRMEKLAGWLDRHTHRRFPVLIGRGGRIVPQTLCVIAGAAMPVLEVVPFSSSILGAAVLCFAVSFLACDGLFVVFGIGFMLVAAVLPIVALVAWL
jgi:hypothetical protein